MSSSVENLQKAIVQGNQSLSQLLRQTKLIAAKLGLQVVEKWADLELNGYFAHTDVPEYRELTTETVTVYHPYRGWIYAGDFRKTIRLTLPAAEIENLSSLTTASYPLDENEKLPLRDALGQPINSDWPQRITTSGDEAVKNQLLQWTIELEKRGIKGEDMDFNEKEKQLATNHVLNIQNNIENFTGVLGDVQNSQVTLYDYGTVNQLLIDHQIPKQDRRELEDIIDDLKEAPSEKKPSLLKRGEDWIVKHKELLGTAAEVVGKVIGSAMK